MFSIPSFSGFKIPKELVQFSSLLISGNFSSPKTRLYAISNQSSAPNTTFNTNIGTGINNYAWNYFNYQGKILMCGFFTTYNGTSAPYFVELNTDGSFSRTGLGTGFNNDVRAIHVQNDGKLICAGNFTSYNGISVNRIVRLNADFTIDGTFNVGTGIDSEVNVMVDDGTYIYVVGGFSTYNGTSRNRFVKIRISDGADVTGVNSGFNNAMFGIAIKGDYIYCTGEHSTYNGSSVSPRVTKINKNTLVADGVFYGNLPNGANDRTYTYNQITNDHLYIQGNFTTINGVSKQYVARISLNGILDTSFPPSTPNGNVLFGRLIDKKKKYAIVGSFTSLGGNPSINRFGVYDINTNSVDTSFLVSLNNTGTSIGEF